MNLRNTSIVIKREYLNKVKKKSFLIITFVVPVLFVALCILPSVIMMSTKEEAKKIAVIDRSGVVLPSLTDTETIDYEDYSSSDLDEAKGLIGNGVDAVLSISEIDSSRTVKAETYSAKPLGIDMVSSIQSTIEDAIEDYRIKGYNIEKLDEILKDVKVSIPLTTITFDEEGKETISESGVFMMVSMILGMIIYMFIAIFGAMVMSSVIEEKSSRVVEVLISSVKATELMFGKIIGVALVALTQFMLWILLGALLLGVAGGIMGGDILSGLSGETAVVDPGTELMMENMPTEATVVLSTLGNLPIGEIFFSFIAFFILGYLLYASLYAALGSAVENEADSQQLTLPVTIPLMLGFFVALYAFKAPDSSLVFWCSMIPFTSPIVMLARIPFGVPGWELALSLLLLLGFFILCAVLSSRVYRAGILKFGKKSSWKDIFKMAKQK